MNLTRIAPAVFKNTLEANATYRALVPLLNSSPPAYKTFGVFVPASVPFPYVVMEYYSGGNDLRDPGDTSDTMWKIMAETNEDEAKAKEIADAIYAALNGKDGVMGTYTGYKTYNPIKEVYPFIQPVNRQSQTIIRAGGIYRLCLASVQGS